MTYVSPPVDPQDRRDVDYPALVLANTRVVPAETVADRTEPPAAEAARFQMQLAIAQQVAANQVRAQQHADTEAAERLASAALERYIAPASSVPARNAHRLKPGNVHL